MVPVETELEKKRFSLLDYIKEADTSHIVNEKVCIFYVFGCVPEAAVPSPIAHTITIALYTDVEA